MTLKAIVHEDETGGYWAEVPALPGCLTQGETKEEILSNLQEGIQAWLEAAEEGEALAGGDSILEVAV